MLMHPSIAPFGTGQVTNGRVDRRRGDGPSIPFLKEDVGRSILERFGRVVEHASQRIAIKSERGSLTYAELDSASDRLSFRIRARTRGEAQPIALLQHDGCQTLTAMLAVLKAGHICVPLDPAYPLDRLDFLLHDSGASLVVTDADSRALAVRLARGQADVIVLEEETAEPFDGCPIVEAPLDRPAVVVYTSGSSGRPKGVILTHRNIVHNAWIYTEFCGLTMNDRVSQLHSYSFSTAITETFFSLFNGALLVSLRVREDGFDRLTKCLLDGAITVFNWIPTPFRYCLESLAGHERFPEVRLVALGAEAVTRRDVDLFRAHFANDCLLLNRLGATEVGNYRFYFIDQTTPIEDRVPAGYAVDDKVALILGDSGEELESGQVGEIAVRSRYLSPGYWRQPELTCAVFSDDPGGEGVRTYHTGDLGLMRADGCLEFHGRKDFQVKIRGVRIEVEEIESRLLECENVRQAAVVLVRTADDHDILAAYIAPVRRPGPMAAELRAQLRLTLPDPMVPSRFITLDALPTTVSGKIDRRALAAPLPLDPQSPGPRDPGGTPTEEAISRIWTEVLKTRAFGPSDDFFELGGHSLTAAQVVARLRTEFGVSVPLESFFAIPTVTRLAALVESACRGRAEPDLPRIRPRASRDERPLAYAQMRLWFVDLIQPGCRAYNVPAAFRVSCRLNESVMRRALEEVVRRHETLRTRIEIRDGRPYAILADAQPADMRVLDLSDKSHSQLESEARRHMVDEADRPFDLAGELPWRAMLIRLCEDDYIFQVTIHHIACDGWSMGVLRAELTALYDAYLLEEVSPLPEPSLQYADYAAWQREWVERGVLLSQLDFWKLELASLPSLDLCTDHARPAVPTFRGAREDFSLSRDITEKLRIVGRTAGGTLFMTLLAGFVAVLHRYTGQTDIAVGTPVAGRRDSALEALVGCFVNMLVLRVDLSNDPSFSELVGRARNTCLRAFDHQDVPFDRLVQELHPERDLSRHPLFQVAFILQNTPSTLTSGGPGLNLEPIEIDPDAARFDLTVSLEETNDGLRGAIEFSTDLFDSPTVERLTGHLAALLSAAATTPSSRLSELAMLTERERRELVVEWNDTAAEPLTDRSISELFEIQVFRRPRAVAVEAGDRKLSYEEVEANARRLGISLAAIGVGPGVLVGLCVERTEDMVIGVLGIFKARGAYVPLDAQLPRARLDYMLTDSAISIIVTRRGIESRFVGTDATLVFLDEAEGVAPEVGRTARPGRSLEPDLAYVIYTSGSTGRPNGVRIKHRSVVNVLESFQKILAQGPRTCCSPYRRSPSTSRSSSYSFPW